MQYLLLIYSNEELDAKRSEADSAQYVQDFQTFTAGIVEAGNFVGGNALLPTGTATSVRVRDGKIITTDGPFAETREALGGYYLIEAADLDEATSIAARIPTSKHGTIEVRPIMVWDEPG